MKKFLILVSLFSFMELVSSCVTPFEPEGVVFNERMLVIEGNILVNDFTRVVLSHSKALDEPEGVEYVKMAQVWVESDKGEKYYSRRVVSGDKVVYEINTAGADVRDNYRLVVNVEGKVYESDFVPVKISPEIDEIGFTLSKDSTEVTFHVNSHDPLKKTNYYMWSYREDWEFNSYIYSMFEYEPNSKKIYEIPHEDNRNTCWNHSVSRDILIASTEHLSEDRVFQKKLVSIGNTDNKINYLYSMQLSQIALTREGYIYWENIRKNSDDIGGIFAPQPSEIAGNIKCVTDPSEKVIGFISASAVSRKRIFTYSWEIGIYRSPLYCNTEPIGGSLALRDSLYAIGYDVVFYTPETGESVWSPKTCVDCRLFGTKTKPSFWPNDHI